MNTWMICLLKGSLHLMLEEHPDWLQGIITLILWRWTFKIAALHHSTIARSSTVVSLMVEARITRFELLWKMTIMIFWIIKMWIRRTKFLPSHLIWMVQVMWWLAVEIWMIWVVGMWIPLWVVRGQVRASRERFRCMKRMRSNCNNKRTRL